VDPRVLQAAARVLAFARAQVIAGLNARLSEDSELPPIDDQAETGDNADTNPEPAADALLGH
jgi:hypothetical protein